MIKSARTVFIRKSSAVVEAEDLYAFIDGIFIDFFHVVTFGLRHIYTVKSVKFGHDIDIVVASAAEMDNAAAVIIEKLSVVRH